MDLNKLIGGAIEKAATEQIKDKAVEIAGEKRSDHVCVRTTGNRILKA